MIFRRRYLWVFGVALVTISVGLVLVFSQQPAASQSIADQDVTVPFTHRVHVSYRLRRAPQAGLPSLSKCMICHNYFTVDDSEGQQAVDRLISAVQNDQAPQWPDVYKQPDFVYFSHQPHVRNGVTCVTCHGDVPNMDLVQKQVDMNMGFCLDCHRKQASQNPEADIPRLTDCNTCHK